MSDRKWDANRLLITSTGTISAAVTDGVTLGHPCCNEYDCKVPLQNVEDEYCQQHDSEGNKCCIEGCAEQKVAGTKTCRVSAHREAVAARAARARKKPKKRRDDEDEEAGTSPLKVKKTKRLKGVFSRKWTHNEQLMVRPCGVVIGRATFYHSESMSGVKVSSYRSEIQEKD